MTLHIAKLCVGATGIDSLSRWQDTLVTRGTEHPYHVTRMYPRRAEEVLDGGSLYWTINGRFAVRQLIVGLERFTDADGIGRCRIDFDRELIPVEPIARRPFQGWRYLEAADAPADLVRESGDADTIRIALSDLGLL